jgi:hypothetical protein
MPNGAQIVDWLGTAMTAARVAADLTAEARDYSEPEPEGKLREALRHAEQAADELRAVLRHVGADDETVTMPRAFLARLMAAVETPSDLSDAELADVLADADAIYHGGAA